MSNAMNFGSNRQNDRETEHKGSLCKAIFDDFMEFHGDAIMRMVRSLVGLLH